MCTEEQEEAVEEQDDQVEEDDDREEEEEDKGDGSTHATFVADLTETTKPQLQENEKPSRRTKPDNRRRRRTRRRRPRREEEEKDAEYLSATGKSEVNRRSF